MVQPGDTECNPGVSRGHAQNRVVNMVLLGKSLRTPNALYYFRNLSFTHNCNENMVMTRACNFRYLLMNAQVGHFLVSLPYFHDFVEKCLLYFVHENVLPRTKTQVFALHPVHWCRKREGEQRASPPFPPPPLLPSCQPGSSGGHSIGGAGSTLPTISNFPGPAY